MAQRKRTWTWSSKCPVIPGDWCYIPKVALFLTTTHPPPLSLPKLVSAILFSASPDTFLWFLLQQNLNIRMLHLISLTLDFAIRAFLLCLGIRDKEEVVMVYTHFLNNLKNLQILSLRYRIWVMSEEYASQCGLVYSRAVFEEMCHLI